MVNELIESLRMDELISVSYDLGLPVATQCREARELQMEMQAEEEKERWETTEA